MRAVISHRNIGRKCNSLAVCIAVQCILMAASAIHSEYVENVCCSKSNLLDFRRQLYGCDDQLVQSCCSFNCRRYHADRQNGICKVPAEGNNVTFDIGTTSFIRSYIDSGNPDGGFIYNITEGSGFRIPLGNIMTIQ